MRGQRVFDNWGFWYCFGTIGKGLGGRKYRGLDYAAWAGI